MFLVLGYHLLRMNYKTINMHLPKFAKTSVLLTYKQLF